VQSQVEMIESGLIAEIVFSYRELAYLHDLSMQVVTSFDTFL
jgi:hypothetical protein